MERGNDMAKKTGILGGDARMRLLSQMLAQDGYEVCTWELPGGVNPTALCDAVKAEVIVLPAPLSKDGMLNGTELPLDELWRLLRPQQQIYAGAVREEERRSAEQWGLTLTDLFSREELTVRNAIPTAEGAIETAMHQLPVTLHGTRCLVVGFGRIGKLLAHDLQAIGAQVTVSARKLSDLAWIDAFGYAGLHTNRLAGKLGGFRVIFNTVPHQVFDESLLREVAPDCLLIELASASGFDRKAVESLRLSYIKAGGLPGKVAPETAALAMKKTLCKLMEGQE